MGMISLTIDLEPNSFDSDRRKGRTVARQLRGYSFWACAGGTSRSRRPVVTNWSVMGKIMSVHY